MTRGGTYPAVQFNGSISFWNLGAGIIGNGAYRHDVFEVELVRGNHYMRDLKILQAVNLGETRATNCNIFDW